MEWPTPTRRPGLPGHRHRVSYWWDTGWRHRWLDLGQLVGPILQRILGGFSGGTGGLDLGHLVGPILQQILGGRRAARMALV